MRHSALKRRGLLSRAQVQVASKVVKAEIINHPDANAEAGAAAGPDAKDGKKGKKCVIQ